LSDIRDELFEPDELAVVLVFVAVRVRVVHMDEEVE